MTIALIGAVGTVLTALLSNRNHGVLRQVNRAVNGHGDERETWRNTRGV